MNRRDFLGLIPPGATLAGLGSPFNLGEPVSGQGVATGAGSFELDEITIDELQRAMQTGRYTARRITELYLGRIDALNRRGPELRAVIDTNSDALPIADALDAERQAGRVRGPLHGIPVLLKANIGSADKMQTTAGSLALEHWSPPEDAHIAARLRAAGAILLGKANMSEWAGGRGLGRIGGWSGTGGQCRNPYVLDRNPQGSSSGSGVGLAANFCVGAVGTDTGGSVTYPASANGVCGMRPTMGLLSRGGIIPLNLSRDTAGPMARTVRDTAIMLAGMVGVDPEDPVTQQSAGKGQADYTPYLVVDGLKGARIVVAREHFGGHPGGDALIESCIQVMKGLGAEFFDVTEGLDTASFQAGGGRGGSELKAGLNAYLAKTPQDFPVRSLADVIAFNERNRDRELQYFGQSSLINGEKDGVDPSDPKVMDARATQVMAARQRIDAALAAHKADAFIAPSLTPTFLTDYVMGDGRVVAPTIPCVIAGYPHLSVPAGYVYGLPVNISFMGRAWSEPVLFRLGYAFEQASRARRKPQFIPTLGDTIRS
ncbi:MAG TPA: amidase [Vicinamibacterales bacterium]|nr:amidase [Vicinamibacterales bacterium]